MTQEKNGSDPVFTPDIKNSTYFPPLLPPINILAKKSILLKKNNRIPVDHIAKITNEGFVKTSHWSLQYWGMYDGS
jgi:hypothetical protein